MGLGQAHAAVTRQETAPGRRIARLGAAAFWDGRDRTRTCDLWYVRVVGSL
jgi:hypothetical protein